MGVVYTSYKKRQKFGFGLGKIFYQVFLSLCLEVTARAVAPTGWTETTCLINDLNRVIEDKKTFTIILFIPPQGSSHFKYYRELVNWILFRILFFSRFLAMLKFCSTRVGFVFA